MSTRTDTDGHGRGTDAAAAAAAAARDARRAELAAARRPLFDLGRLLMTRGVAQLAEVGAVNPLTLLARHARGDWGDLDAEDKAANEAALLDGGRILSAYDVRDDVGGDTIRYWIITEAADDDGRRAATTVLLPDEY